MNRKASFLLVMLAALFFLACGRKQENIGPSLCPSGSFAVLQPLAFYNLSDGATNAIDFVSSAAHLSLLFNEVIEFKVRISAPSGAVYEQMLKSDRLNQNWYGNSTNGIAFQKGDVLTCQVSNTCRQEPLGSMSGITVGTLISYNNGFGIKIVNFEDNVNTNHSGNISYAVTAASAPSPQGGNCLSMTGTLPPGNAPTYYFGEVGFSGIALPNAAFPSDPSEVYLNFYARGAAHTQWQLVLRENVYGTSIKRLGAVNVTPEWSLYSIKLSDIGVLDPRQIQSLELDLASSVPAQSAAADIDMILFTFQNPLNH